MSILIKGMEMPKDIEPGLVIEFADGIDGKRYARLWHYRHGGLTEWLEAIPVPPHGRLIDADALKAMWDNEVARLLEKGIEYLDYHVDTLFSDFKHDVDKMPTIIPADHIGDANEMVKAEEGET